MRVQKTTIGRRFPVRAFLSHILVVSFSLTANAQSGSWSALNSGNWGTATNWNGSIIANGANNTATFGPTSNANLIVSLDTSRTIGNITFNNTSRALSIVPQSTQVLTLEKTTSPTIEVTGSSTSLTISTALAGSGGFTKNGDGLLVLSGANSISGTALINRGVLQVNSAGALGNLDPHLNGGSLTLRSDTAFNLSTRNVTVSANSTIISSRVTTGVGLIHEFGTLSIGSQTLTLGFSLPESGTAGLTFGTTTVSGNATFIVGGSNGSTAQLTLGALNAGANTITKSGLGPLILGTAASSFSGGVHLSVGTLQINNSAALGTASISFAPSSAARLVVQTGVNLANDITIPNGLAGAANRGLLEKSDSGQVGQATFSGTITINGNVTNGGHVFNDNFMGNEIILAGPINGTGTSFQQIDGRVIYSGGGTLAGILALTGTALIGATDGLPTGLAPTLGTFGKATLDLNGFNQAVAGLTFGTTGQAHVGIVNIGSNTLTLNGNLTSAAGTTASHTIATTGGTINLGPVNRTFNIANNTTTPANNDLTIGNATIIGTSGLTKTGAGALALNGTMINGPVTHNVGELRGTPLFNGGLSVNSGAMLVPGSATTGGTMSSAGLTFGAGVTTLDFNLGTLGDTLNNSGPLIQTGVTTINFGSAALGSFLTNNTTYPVISYTGTTPGTSGFAIGTIPQRANALIVDTGTAIALQVNSVDRVIWTGASGGNWDVNNTQSWKLQSNNTATGFLQGDDLIFDDSGVNTNPITLNTAANPARIDFQNTTALPYTISGTGSLNGQGQFVKSGNGIVTLNLSGTSTLAGPTTVAAGLLEIKQANFSHLTSVQNLDPLFNDDITIASGATLKLSSRNIGFSFPRNLTGSGTLLVDLADGGTHSATTPIWIDLLGDNSGFSGLLKLSPNNPANGSFRTQSTSNPKVFGAATIDIDAGAQIWLFGATFNNNITITGVGVQETSGGANTAVAPALIAKGFAPYATNSGIGALRLDSGAKLTGTITLDGSAKIGGGVSGTISGSIKTTNLSDLLAIGGGTLILTGTNNLGTNPLNEIWINTGSSSAGFRNIRLQVGNSTTTGTLGVGDVLLYSVSSASSVLDLRRSDGYALGTNQDIRTAPGSSAFYNIGIDLNTTGTGFTVGATNVIDITDSPATGLPATTGGSINVGQAINNSIFNINNGAIVRVAALNIGDFTSLSGVVNQAAGSTVEIVERFHLTQDSTYHMNGGSLTMTGASPSTNPTASISRTGGLYIGISGRAIMNQNGGTVTTNFVVLDNRITTDTGSTIVGGGFDQYNLNGGTLNLRSTWGFKQRGSNPGELNFSGGTIRVDNSGTGTGTGANIIVPIDSNIRVTGSVASLDTNAAINTGNGFVLRRNILGTGTLATQGGGTVTLNPVGSESGSLIQLVTANIAGTSPINKAGANSITKFLSPQTYTGATTVSGGTLELNNSMATSALTVSDGAAVAGEPTIPAVTLGSTTGARLFFDPTTAGSLKGSTIAVNGTLIVDFSSVPVGAGPFPVLQYTTNNTPTATYALANAVTYRSTPIITDDSVGNIILSGLLTKALTWSGTNAIWDANVTANWKDSNSLAGPSENFFSYDSVTFDDSIAGVSSVITATGVVQPSGITVNSATINYTINGDISGAGGLTKSGNSTLTLEGANTFTGMVTINGGTLLMTGSIAQTKGVANNATLVYDRSDTIEINYIISGDGTVIHQGVGTTAFTGANSYAGGTTISGGRLQVGADGTVGSGNVTNNAAFDVARSGLTTAAIDGTGTTTVTASGATLTANHIRQSTLNIGAGNTVTIAANGGGSGTSLVTNLSISTTGKLDLTNNDLIVDNGNLATLTAKLASGLDINGSYGNGPGITSSTFATNPNFNTVLGIAPNSYLDYVNFSGQTVDSNDVLIKYTYFGDADLNGSVDTATDFDLYITGLTSGGSIGGWLYGDFDYNGTVDSATDFDLYITGLTGQGSQLLTVGSGSPVTAIPEPSTWVMGCLGMTGLAAWRLRKRLSASENGKC